MSTFFGICFILYFLKLSSVGKIAQDPRADFQFR